ncbi:hypothetical protein I8752_15650 [Nostocaceae cyanobacterium CENA369]|uniref:Uncharacterized protein n=1 Tax=Dendronalium phyllosphericum CENA369 TaxID=1725256 RepID=A0A8J7I7D7_9NOST|nr:hypothetical protein [Dendronalium phyllosphericum]MBH8574430.1 hypothetical protein [Dendronalium phyllosphericum CENA369]
MIEPYISRRFKTLKPANSNSLSDRALIFPKASIKLRLQVTDVHLPR